MSTSLLGAILAISAAISYAVTNVLIRRVTVSGKSMDVVMSSIVINCLIFIPLSLVLHYSSPNLTPASLLAFVMAGLLGTFLARVCLFSSIEKIGASRTAPISRGSMIVSSLLSVLVLGESITMGHLAGILVLFAGVVTITREIESDEGNRRWKPSITLLLPLGAMFFMGLSRPIAKFGLSSGAPVTVGLAVKFAAALVFSSGYFFWKGISPLRPFLGMEKRGYLAIGLINSIGMGFLYLALNTARVVVVVPFLSLFPFFILLLSPIYLRKLEHITLELVLGTILAVSGAILIGIFM